MAKHILDGNFFLEIEEQNSWHWNQMPDDFIIDSLEYNEYIFVHEDSYLLNEIRKDIIIVFYPNKRRTYLIDKLDYENFKLKYFPNKKVLLKKPTFFMFQIPFPTPVYQSDKYNWYSNNILLTISKNIVTKYRNEDDFTLRIIYNYNDELKKYDFDSIFLKTFEDVVKISDEYKIYLSNLLNINKCLIKTNKLIQPFYKISPEEIEQITNDFFDLLEEAESESMKREADYQDKIFNSELDELNWIALERDRTNYWNID